MATHEEISSTEKLLDLIRSGTDTEVEVPNRPSPSSSKRKKPVFPISWFSRQRPTIGIELGSKHLRLVKVQNSTENRGKLLDHKTVPFDPGMPRGSPEFSSFLKSTLNAFCGSTDAAALWLLFDSPDTQIRTIRIPKVAKKHIANAAYWTFKKEAPFDEKESIFDFEVIGNIPENGIQKTSLLAYTAPRQKIEHLRDLFSGIGFPLTGISAAPFAIQNLLRTRWVDAGKQAVACLNVGEDWSRIDIFSSGNLLLTREIKAGMNAFVEGIAEGLKKRQTASTPAPAEGSDDSHAADPGRAVHIPAEETRQLLLSIRDDVPQPVNSPEGTALGEQETFKMLLPALDRLVRQVERSLKYYSLKLGDNSVSKIYVSGEISTYSRLIRYVRDQVGMPTDIIDPLAQNIQASEDVSESTSTREGASLSHAAGMALSSGARTPNFIFTYTDREKRERFVRINRSVFATFLLLIALCAGIFMWQGRIAAMEKSRLRDLQHELAKYDPRLNQHLILRLFSKAKQNEHLLRAYSRKYLGTAVIAELSLMTPSNIRLTDIAAKFGKPSATEAEDPAKALLLEGMIFGDGHTLEASLASYLLKLESSPVFAQPSLEASTPEIHEGEKMIHFKIHLTVM